MKIFTKVFLILAAVVTVVFANPITDPLLFPDSAKAKEASEQTENLEEFEPRNADEQIELFDPSAREEESDEELPTEEEIRDIVATIFDPLPNEDIAQQNEDMRDKFALTPSAILESQAGIHDFTQAFLVQAWDSEGANFVFSPFSLHTALAILTSAATDNSTTQSELLSALGRVKGIQSLENRYAALIDDYLKNTGEVLSFGTKCWTSQEIFRKISGRFTEKMEGLYDVTIDVLQGKNPENDINQWVNEKTKGKIDKIIDFVSPEAALLIVNALYFKAAWSVTFEDAEQLMDFTNENGDQIKTKMMTRSSFQNTVIGFTTDLLPNGKFIAIAIPYEESRFEFVIVMPEDHRHLTFLKHQIQAKSDDPRAENILDVAIEALRQERSSFKKEKIITMPSFSIDSNINVVNHLRKMGINAAFETGGFDNIVKGEAIKVSDIKHRATIEVTKDGTVGAAATAIELVSFSGTFDVPEEVLINKPFLFFVRDMNQLTILFAGKFGQAE